MRRFHSCTPPFPTAPDTDTVAINGRRYRLGETVTEGRYSRIVSVEPLGGGDNPASLIVKRYVCTRRDAVWQTAMREINAARQLQNCRHIVRLLGSTERNVSASCEVFLLMQRLTCCDSVFGGQPADEARVTDLCRDVADALFAMRRKGLTHGDVKPANIYFEAESGWQLGDFGSVTRRGERPLFVSEGYCSPEARRGAVCDWRSDCYALGLTAYRLLSGGRLPFCDRPCREMNDDDVYEAIGRRLRGEPIPPLAGVSDEMNRAVLAMCAYEPTDRKPFDL